MTGPASAQRMLVPARYGLNRRTALSPPCHRIRALSPHFIRRIAYATNEELAQRGVGGVTAALAPGICGCCGSAGLPVGRGLERFTAVDGSSGFAEHRPGGGHRIRA